jgi:8-oxo-dGTP diphosphatase
MEHTYPYPRPSVTVDMLIFVKNPENIHVLLIKRGSSPFKNSFALPGGFMDMEETLEEAAHRELKEETGLMIEHLEELKTFSKLGRDPRGRTITVVYYAVLEGKCPAIVAGDDAKSAKWFPAHSLPALAFDHNEIIRFGLQRIFGE